VNDWDRYPSTNSCDVFPKCDSLIENRLMNYPLKLDVIRMSNGVGTIIAEGSLIWWLKKADDVFGEPDEVSSPLDIYQR